MSRCKYLGNLFSPLCKVTCQTNAPSKVNIKVTGRCKYFGNLLPQSFSTSHTITVERSHIAKSQCGDMTREASARCQSEGLDANILAICSRRGRSYGVCSGMWWHQLVTSNLSSATTTSQVSSSSMSPCQNVKELKRTKFKNQCFWHEQDWLRYEALSREGAPGLCHQRLACENMPSN